MPTSSLLYNRVKMELRFDASDLLAHLERASVSDFDEAPFGIVQMFPDGVVSGYNTFESRLSGLSPGTVKGRNFFVDVAPCTNNYMVAQKFEDSPELDETVDYVFTFRMRPMRVQLRLMKSAAAGHQYLLVTPKA